MKVALVYDRVNKFGGAERVLLDLHQLYPQAPIYSLVHNPKKTAWASKINIIPTYFNKLNFLKSRHELLAPLAAMAFESFNFDEYDVVISVSSADAKAVITKPHTLHINYCLTPTRYLWSGVAEYRSRFSFHPVFDLYLKHARSSDLVYASRPDYYFAISQEVKKRLQKYYRRDSEVIYPAIDFNFWSRPEPEGIDDYYLVVSRLVPYKKVDLVIRAFNKLNKRLLIVGSGSQLSELRSISKSNISFEGHPDDAKLRYLYSHAKALIFPQIEDFGLVPLEAQATGTPVIAYADGGVLETVIENKTGVFFNSQTQASLIDAVNFFESDMCSIKRSDCQKQAERFSRSGFIDRFSAKVDTVWQEYQKKNMS